MTSRALHVSLPPLPLLIVTTQLRASDTTASDVPLEPGLGDDPDAAFTSCTTRHGVKSVTNRRSAGRNYTRYGHFNAISSLRHRPKGSGHPTRVTLRSLFRAETGENLCLFTHPAHRDIGKDFKCFHSKPYEILRLAAVQEAH